MGSSAPKTPTNTTQTINTNSIPDFMQPYFNTMMSSAQGQVYQRDAQGNVSGLQSYQPYSTNPNDYVAPLSGLQNQAIQGAGNLQVPGQFQQGSQMVGGSGAGALGIGMQAANAGNQYNQMATDPNALKGFMSPYMQNVVNYETGQANRQYDITGQEQQAAAARSGAFGGSREAIMGAENERNRNQAITGIQSTGAEKAFQNAQQGGGFLSIGIFALAGKVPLHKIEIGFGAEKAPRHHTAGINEVLNKVVGLSHCVTGECGLR